MHTYIHTYIHACWVVHHDCSHTSVSATHVVLQDLFACSHVCVACDAHHNFLTSSRRKTNQCRASQRWDRPWLAKGQKSDRPSVLLLSLSYLPSIERCFTRWICVASHVFPMCMLLIRDTSLLPTIMLHGARRHDASVRGLSQIPYI